MNKEKGGAIAAAGVIAVGGGHFVASGGHLLPSVLRDTKPVASRIHTAPSGQKFEVPEWVVKSGEEAIKHCLKELDGGRDCTRP